MEIIFKDYQYKGNKLNFTINEKQINGITGNNLSAIISIIKLKYNYQGKIIIDGNEIKKKEINLYKKKMVLVRDSFPNHINIKTLYELMIYIMKSNKIYPKNIDKKIKDSLKIVGLETSLLERNIYEISTSEKKLILLAIALQSNPSVLILSDFFKGLDLKNRKKIDLLLRKIKDQYNKTIVFVTNDSEVLYKYTENLILFNNNNTITTGRTVDIYQKVDLLKRNKISIPEIVDFTYKAKKSKKVKIDYHKDIRDLIKDIYKHV